MVRKCLVFTVLLASFAGYLYATCNDYEDSRVSHFENGETSCAYTGPGCRECYVQDDWGVLSCWTNWPYSGCHGFNDPGPYTY